MYERTWEQNGLVFASVAQVAIDRLTGFGRMPAEGEALLDWMRQTRTSMALDNAHVQGLRSRE